MLVYDECGPENRSIFRPNIIRPEHVPYFEGLLARDSEHVLFLDPDEIPPEFEPGRCHCNVQKWVQASADYLAVPGWLYGLSSIRPQYAFMCHSVAQRIADGTLLDVSPFPGQAIGDRRRYMFYRHLLADGDYQPLKALYADASIIR